PPPRPLPAGYPKGKSKPTQAGPSCRRSSAMIRAMQFARVRKYSGSETASPAAQAIQQRSALGREGPGLAAADQSTMMISANTFVLSKRSAPAATLWYTQAMTKADE